MARVVPSPCRGARATVAQVVQCQTYVARPTETFAQVLSRVNDSMAHGSGER